MRNKGTELIYAAVILGACLVGLAGCTTVGPDYQPPQTSAPTNWSSALSGGLSGAAADTNLLEQWWTVFNDPILSDLIERARAGNLDLRQAEARVREARAQRGIAKQRCSRPLVRTRPPAEAPPARRPVTDQPAISTQRALTPVGSWTFSAASAGPWSRRRQAGRRRKRACAMCW